MILHAFYVAVLFLLLPEQAHAWGGGIHLQLGATVLGNLPGLSTNLASLLAAHPHDFLYGCISADITLGKKFTHSMLNCHRWRIGRKVLQAARTNSERACAYGYLSHLAADVIAHNYYVPYKIMRSFSSVTMKHAYWEMRFETFVAKDIWETAQNVCRADQCANDALLRGVLTNTIFSFGTNKRIFNSIMVMARMDRLQKILQTLSSKSRYQLAETDRDEYMELSREAIFDFLRNPDDSKFLRMDPTGEKALAVADALRRSLRLRYKSGFMSKAEGFEQVEAVRSTLRKSLHKPELLKKLHV